MREKLAVLLAALLLCALCACGGQAQTEPAAPAADKTEAPAVPAAPDPPPAAPEQPETPDPAQTETPDPAEEVGPAPEQAPAEPPAAPPEEKPAAPTEKPADQPAAPAEKPAEKPAEEVPEYPTYGEIMTDGGRFRLGSFLAAVTSAHNRGIALDLTLETAELSEELEMQSAIHDLSWYSAVYLNNGNAELLAKYMTGVGMVGLSSEWWHFQDNETREAIGLTSYLYKGVDAGGWTRDDRGWRWRDADGSYYRSTTVTVDGKRYTLDRDGYTSQAPEE